jgi:hypothetical protein
MRIGENMKIALKIYHLLAFVVLAWFAALQLNDPDPLYWGGFYALCALVPLLAAFRIESLVLWGGCVIYGFSALVLTASGELEYLRHAGTESLLHGMSADKPYIEEAREFLGVLIALALVTVYPLTKRKRASAGV